MRGFILPTFEFGTNGDDTIRTGATTDLIIAFRGNDNIASGRGDDLVFGGGGNDRIAGQAGNDYLNGGDGNDRIFGGTGDDIIIGGNGNDILRGDTGNDWLFGGANADLFFFNPNRVGEGADVIADFELGTDKILLRASDVLASTPGLPDADGTPGFAPTDLDASAAWDITAGSDGDAVIVHPNGTIELDGIAFDPSLTFEAIFDAAIELI